jgi:hypothetical protein
MPNIPNENSAEYKKTSSDHKKYIKQASVKKEEVEPIEEKAPPGDKYERMVKHIKKGYSKDGLSDKEKSIAYATAWKAKNKKDK